MEERGVGLIRSTSKLMPKGKTYFLGIGINKYKHFEQQLNNACSDVEAVRDVLVEKYSFDPAYTDILLDEDASRENILEKLYKYLGEAATDDRVLIYFAGHGLMRGSSGFWLPSDSKPDRFGSYINNAEVRDIIHASSARHVLLISDSCFSGSLIVRDVAKVKVRAFEEWSDKQSRWIFSSGKGPVSDGFAGGHSPFAQRIIDQLLANSAPILNIVLLADSVTKEVSWNYEQQAECSPLSLAGHNGGQFLFYATPASAPQSNSYPDLIYDFSKDTSHRQWGLVNSLSNINESIELKRGPDYYYRLTARVQIQDVGLNLFNLPTSGKVKFSFMPVKYNRSLDNLLFYIIPIITEKGASPVELGFEQPADYRNAYSSFRIKYISDAEVNAVASGTIEYDFSKDSEVKYVIFAPRINEGCPNADSGEMLLLDTKVYTDKSLFTSF